MKQYFYILLLYTLLNCSFILTDTSVKENTNSGKNSTNNTNIVLTEGGKINITSVVAVTDGREHGVQLTTQATVEKKMNVTTNTATVQQSTTATAVVSSTTVKPSVKPVTEVETTGDGRVKARKGVTLTEVTSNTTPQNATQSTTTTSSTTTTPTTTLTPSTTVFIPRKPTVTYGDEDDIAPPHSNSHLFNFGKEIAPKNSTQSPPLPKEDPILVGLGSRHVKGSDYVLTIVLIILAVPLVAIILTVLYKRSAEWWSHRHYRRMDFLIDGMYNN